MGVQLFSPNKGGSSVLTFLLSSEAKFRALSALPSSSLNVSAFQGSLGALVLYGSLHRSLCWLDAAFLKVFRLCLALTFRHPTAV